MWERKELKQRAKDVLRVTYWKAFLVSIIFAIIGGGGSGSSTNFNLGRSDSSGGEIDWASSAPVIIAIVVIFIFIFLFFLAFRIFLGFPLEVGSVRFFKQASTQHQGNLNHLGYAFGGGRYWNIIKAMFWKGFLNFLWYLLLIIPGIVKSYSYFMVPYILSDNPNVGTRRAVDLSNQMTRGHKFRMFVLDLSFLGWIFLGILACGIGVLFVLPYIHATKAELYLELRQQAIRNGLTTEEELRLREVF